MPQEYIGLPRARKGQDVASPKPTTKNPVLRGYSLVVVAYIVCKVDFLARFLWKNAGFGKIQKLSDLAEYEPRWDPTVVPVPPASEAGPASEHNLLESSDDQTKAAGGREQLYSATDYRNAYLEGKLSPTSVVEAFFEAIDAEKDHRVAFISFRIANALAAAQKSTARYKSGKSLGPLDGVPVAIKDEVDLEGHSRCCGSNITVVESAKETSWCVRKWQEAGAIVIGKTNMHEFGMDTTNCNSVRGTPRNPHNSGYFCGGSSGGSAYLVSAGLVPIALGADGGGSIRLPSSYCGIYGLKPTHGRISASPTPSLAPSVGVVGPMAATLGDLALAYQIMAEPDPDNSTSSQFPSPLQGSGSKREKIIGVIPSQLASASSIVRTLCELAVDHYANKLGYHVVRDLYIPHPRESQLAHNLTIMSEIFSLIRPLVGSSLSGLSPANKVLLSIARQTPAADLIEAQKLRNLLMQHLSHLFVEHPDLIIVSPTTPQAGRRIQPGDLAHGVSDGDSTIHSMENVWLANFTGCPAISIPLGKVEGDGGGGEVPVGLMGMAMWGNEEGLFEWARDLQTQHEGQGVEFSVGRPAAWVDLVGLAEGQGSAGR